MRPQRLSRVHRIGGQALVVLALLTAMPIHPAFAQDALIPQAGPTDDVPVLQQAGQPAPGPSSNQLVPTTQFVEDPTRQAGGEDDAQRANERTIDQRNDDDHPRRK